MIRNFRDGDIVTSGAHFVRGKEATQQGVIRRLRLFLGEYFLNAAEGTDWFGSVLGKAPQDMAEAEIKRRIVTTPGVVGLTAFSFDFEQQERRITIQASVIDENNEIFDVLLDERII